MSLKNKFCIVVLLFVQSNFCFSGPPQNTVPMLDGKFSFLYAWSRTQALKYWLKSLPSFQKWSYWNIKVSDNSNLSGKNSIGIYTVETNHSSATYIIKVITSKNDCDEFKRLLTLQEDHQVTAAPNLPQVIHAIAAARTENYCFALLEKAPGEALHDLYLRLERDPFGRKVLNFISYDLGKKLGSMHTNFSTVPNPKDLNFQTRMHVDLNGGNIFYQIESRKAYLIDNDKLSMYPYSPQIKEEIFERFYLIRRIEFYIKEARKVDFPNQPNPTFRDFLSSLFEDLNFFAKGYIEQFPIELQSQIRTLFTHYCESLESQSDWLAQFPPLERCKTGRFYSEISSEQFEKDWTNQIDEQVRQESKTPVTQGKNYLFETIEKSFEIKTIM